MKLELRTCAFIVAVAGLSALVPAQIRPLSGIAHDPAAPAIEFTTEPITNYYTTAPSNDYNFLGWEDTPYYYQAGSSSTGTIGTSPLYVSAAGTAAWSWTSGYGCDLSFTQVATATSYGPYYPLYSNYNGSHADTSSGALMSYKDGVIGEIVDVTVYISGTGLPSSEILTLKGHVMETTVATGLIANSDTMAMFCENITSGGITEGAFSTNGQIDYNPAPVDDGPVTWDDIILDEQSSDANGAWYQGSFVVAFPAEIAECGTWTNNAGAPPPWHDSNIQVTRTATFYVTSAAVDP
jgi:hypothetical protein